MHRYQIFFVLAMVSSTMAGDMLRKSIVFDPKTPDLFYCPQQKPTSFDEMFVVATSLKKLCEFKGGRLPMDYKSDCYNDVDESDWACREKKRIMMRLYPPGYENAERDEKPEKCAAGLTSCERAFTEGFYIMW